MKYRILIGDYSKLLRVLTEVSILGFSTITMCSFLINRYFAFPSTLGIVLFFSMILVVPINLIIRLRGIEVKESIIVERGYIICKKYGNLEFKNIKSYKYQTFQSDVLILEMYNGTKYAITRDMKNYSDYFEFKIMFSKLMNEENQKRQSMGIEEIMEKKSFSKYLNYLQIIISILALILVFIHYVIKKF